MHFLGPWKWEGPKVFTSVRFLAFQGVLCFHFQLKWIQQTHEECLMCLGPLALRCKKVCARCRAQSQSCQPIRQCRQNHCWGEWVDWGERVGNWWEFAVEKCRICELKKSNVESSLPPSHCITYLGINVECLSFSPQGDSYDQIGCFHDLPCQHQPVLNSERKHD